MTATAVVIPCWNDGETVGDTVASARDQADELLVVDDGSTDPATLAVLERLRADGVGVLRVENGGPSAARMAGLAGTTAPYVFPLDADDELVPGALAALAHALDGHPRAANSSRCRPRSFVYSSACRAVLSSSIRPDRRR